MLRSISDCVRVSHSCPCVCSFLLRSLSLCSHLCPHLYLPWALWPVLCSPLCQGYSFYSRWGSAHPDASLSPPTLYPDQLVWPLYSMKDLMLSCFLYWAWMLIEPFFTVNTPIQVSTPCLNTFQGLFQTHFKESWCRHIQKSNKSTVDVDGHLPRLRTLSGSNLRQQKEKESRQNMQDFCYTKLSIPVFVLTVFFSRG